ncbi:MAG TPA: PD-(D/E)XK nuclease family protein [Caulobacteraceae bacterium]
MSGTFRAADRVARLGRFFEQIRPLAKPARARANAAPNTRRAHCVPTLRSFFEKVREPLAAARARGDFIDIWAVAGLNRREVRNASVLAWLLDPRGSHGQGSGCLEAFTAQISRADPSWRLDPSILRLFRVRTEQRPLGSDRDRVDIAIDGPGFLIFIEVKIDAGEGLNQLSRYTESAAAKAAASADAQGHKPRTLVAFLSPMPPSKPVAGLVHLSWSEVADALVEASAYAEGTARFVVRSFAKHIRSFV